MAETRMSRLEDKIDQLVRLAVTLENHEVKIDIMNDKIDELKGRVSELEDNINANNTRLSSIGNMERIFWLLVSGALAAYVATASTAGKTEVVKSVIEGLLN